MESTSGIIFEKCRKFRILILGKSGVGKTTLVMRTFNIDELHGSDLDPGKCNINDEIFSSQNEHFVLHDSQGFEAGETDNFDTVKKFIESRAKEPLIKDQLHAIWLCLQIPRTGGRLIEAGDENFLRLAFQVCNVPIVASLTQIDLLYDQIKYDLLDENEDMDPDSEETKRLIKEKAERYLEESCIKPLKELAHRTKRFETVWVSTEPEYRHTLENLVKVTLDLVRNHVQEIEWITLATAQRVSANANVASCIDVGKRKYWRGLAAGTYFANSRLRACVDVIHKDIVDIWNFRDEDEILQNESFKATVCALVQDLADADGQSPGSDLITGLQKIKAGLDVATPISGPLAPIVASVGISVMSVKWLSEMYNSTPGVLRCLMGYIVEITIVLEVLFWFKISQPHLPSLCQEDIDAAFGLYQRSTTHLDIHKQIRKYVGNMKRHDWMNDSTHLEVESLINSHRSVLIPSLFSDTQEATNPTGIGPTRVQHIKQENDPISVEPTKEENDTKNARPAGVQPTMKENDRRGPGPSRVEEQDDTAAAWSTEVQHTKEQSDPADVRPAEMERNQKQTDSTAVRVTQNENAPPGIEPTQSQAASTTSTPKVKSKWSRFFAIFGRKSTARKNKSKRSRFLAIFRKKSTTRKNRSK